MSKSEILKEHVLNTARGLSTTDLNDVIKELETLEDEKIKAVIESICITDLEELGILYDKLCEGDPIDVVIKLT